MKLLILLVVFVGASYACQDKWSDWCYNSRSYCSSHASMRRDCPRTCGTCGVKVTNGPTTIGPCQDKWSDWCYNSQTYCSNTASVRRDCPLTCGICGTRKPVTFKPYTQLPGSCGLRQVSSGKVIGGKDAKRGDWPWQILLQQNGWQMCGGTIIDKRYIVTAAHCIEKYPYASYYSVVVGETDRKRKEGSEITIQAERVIIHPNRVRHLLNNDIALIKLKSDIPFGKYVQPACLPSASINPGHHECYITGWGKIRHPGYMHSKLQQARMPPVDNNVCEQKNRMVINVPITSDMVCAGEGGINPIHGCHGDSGGPYVCKVNGKWEFHGAVSHGSPRCWSHDAYTVFARISYFKQWIIETMQHNGV